jgi:hypothetical protein
MSDSELLFYPQSYLVHYVAFSTPRDGPLQPNTPYGFLDPRIKASKLGLSKKYMNLAKIGSVYHPEAVFSKIMTTGQEPKKIDKYFLNIDNHKLSALTPEVRLYRVDKEARTVKPFYFPTVSDYNFVGVGTGNLLDLGKPHTSNAAGIENFSVKLTGKNPFQASRKFLEATLTVRVDSIALLFDLPTGFEKTHAPLADLFTIRTAQDTKTPGSNKKKPGGVLEKGKSCQIAATMGYSTHSTEIFSAKELGILRKTHQVINLFYSSHNLTMNQDGSATISVKYTGFLDALSGASEYDFISSIKSKTRLQKARAGGAGKEKEKQSLSDLLSNKTVSDKDSESTAANTTPEEVTVPTVGDIMSSFRQIFDTLHKKAKVHVIPTGDIAIRKKILLGNHKMPPPPAAATSTAASKINKTWRVANLSAITATAAQSSGINPFEFINRSYVAYITLGDLLDSYFLKIGEDLTKIEKSINGDKEIAENLKTKLRRKMASHFGELKNLNVFMSDIIYTKKQEGSSSIEERRINIADIPISLSLFYGMIYEKITNPRVSFYDMRSFLIDFLPMLLTRSFGELPGADVLNPITFTTTTYTSSELPPGSITEGDVSVRRIPSPIQTSAKKGVKKQAEYIIIHQEMSNHTKSLGRGDKDEDLKNGIYHLRASQNSGIVKKIDFSRLPSPAREAYMIVRNGNIYDELRYAHNASIEMVGNSIFYPSCCVYVNPESLGFGDPRGDKSAARRLGFGGYYMVGDVTTTFSQGQLNTVLNLHFNSFPEDTSSAAQSGTKEKKSMKDLQNPKSK